MATVTFQGGTMPDPLVCEYDEGDQSTILGLARRNAIPLYWRCGQGTCGACAAKVTVVAGTIRAMDNRERNVLLREGHFAGPTPLRTNWRLTCGYVLSGEDVLVNW